MAIDKAKPSPKGEGQRGVGEGRVLAQSLAVGWCCVLVSLCCPAPTAPFTPPSPLVALLHLALFGPISAGVISSGSSSSCEQQQQQQQHGQASVDSFLSSVCVCASAPPPPLSRRTVLNG